MPNNSFTEFLLYTTPNSKVKVEIFLRDETIWLTQYKIAQLFGVQRPAITKHLKNIFQSNELDEKVVSSILEHTTQHGAIKGKLQTRPVKFYNLDAFLQLNEKKILANAALVSAEIAKTFAGNQFEKYRVIQDRLFESDFDREIKQLEGKKS